jgi:hypothetical protein
VKRAWSLVVFAIACAAAVIVARTVWLARDPGPDVHRPQGYELIANLFLHHRWLQFDEEKTQIALAAEQDKAAPGGAFRRSFLAADVDAFNGGERSIFRIDNQIITGVDATRHNIVLPYGNVDQWKGSLRYRSSGTLEASLRGVGIDLQLVGLTSDLLRQKPPEATLRGDRRAEPVVTVRSEAINVFGRPAVYLGKIYLAGPKIIVNNRNSPSSVSMWISGQRVPQGNRAWLSPGDVLKLEWRPNSLARSRYALLWSEGGRSADVISTPCAINGRWSRCPEKPSLPLAADVIATMNSGVAGRRPGADDDFDIVMTLDRELHRQVQEALEKNRRDAPDRAKDGPVRRRNTRAAVTVMNALTGEILALASYPTETALSRVDLPDTVESRLLRNHNFSRMPVGSVAKVLFGAAIADADPRLLSLKLRQHGTESVDTVAGITVAPPIETHPVGTGSDGLVGFDEFIGYSSNEYAALLLTLACATKAGSPLPVFTGDPLPQEGRYSIAGTEYDHAPSPLANDETRLKLLRDAKGRTVGGTQSALEGEAWADSFTKLFGVEKIVTTPINARKPEQGDGVIDTSVWQPVLRELYGKVVPADHPFRAIGVERENLALNLSYVYRTQLLSLMYGGAAARFTNPKLAEMFSRLVTGKKVEQSLVAGVARFDADPPPVQRQFAALGLADDTRAALLDGMTSVVRGPAGEPGTAGELYAMLSEIDGVLATRKQALGFFSKTGSPRTSITVPSGLARAVNALIASGAIGLTPDGAIAYRGAVIYENAEVGSEPPWLRSIRGNARDLAILRRNGVPLRLLHSALVLYNVETPENRARVFTTLRGRLIRMNGVKEITATGAVYVFTIAVYDGASRRSARPLDVDAVHHQPLRAQSVAITIEGQGKSTDVAVPFAKTLIRDVIWPAMEQEAAR